MTYRMFWGHALNGLAQLKVLGYQARCCVTSPPYYSLRDYEVGDVIWADGTKGQLGLEETPDLYIHHLMTIFDAVRDVMTDDGTLWIVIGDSYAGSGGPGSQYDNSKKGPFRKFRNPSRKLADYKNKDLITIPWMLGQALREDGWFLRCGIIWNKPTARPNPVKDRPSIHHEYILFLSKNSRCFFDYDAVKSTEIKRSVWNISPANKPIGNWAEFPVELPMRCILAGSEIHDFVLDPFMGSGTTAEAAELLGRYWLGCELDEGNKPFLDERLNGIKRKQQYELFRMSTRD